MPVSVGGNGLCLCVCLCVYASLCVCLWIRCCNREGLNLMIILTFQYFLDSFISATTHIHTLCVCLSLGYVEASGATHPRLQRNSLQMCLCVLAPLSVWLWTSQPPCKSSAMCISFVILLLRNRYFFAFYSYFCFRNCFPDTVRSKMSFLKVCVCSICPVKGQPDGQDNDYDQTL